MPRSSNADCTGGDDEREDGMNKPFPNLAGLPEQEATRICTDELGDAGIPAVTMFPWAALTGEVRSRVEGDLQPWSFKRAWRYWVARGSGIPPDAATELHETHGTEVRVAGHCGCPSPREWFKGFAVDLYHVDTPEGLRALVALIRKVKL